MVKVGSYRLTDRQETGQETELRVHHRVLSPPVHVLRHSCKWWNHNVLMKKSHSLVFSRAARVIRED